MLKSTQIWNLIKELDPDATVKGGPPFTVDSKIMLKDMRTCTVQPINETAQTPDVAVEMWWYGAVVDPETRSWQGLTIGGKTYRYNDMDEGWKQVTLVYSDFDAELYATSERHDRELGSHDPERVAERERQTKRYREIWDEWCPALKNIMEQGERDLREGPMREATKARGQGFVVGSTLGVLGAIFWPKKGE